MRAPRIPIDMPNHTEKKAGVTPPFEARTVHRADAEFMPTCVTRLRQSLEEESQEGHGKLRTG